jgi:hypothetical protein
MDNTDRIEDDFSTDTTDLTVKLKTKPLEYESMVRFLEIPANFAVMVGKGAKDKSVRGGQRLTIKHGMGKYKWYSMINDMP